MRDEHRIKLLFGPYKAPPLKRGDRAFCLMRDCAVVVTGRTGARIPWPRCRALDSTGGGSGIPNPADRVSACPAHAGGK
jgi:hypothetical protein